MDITTSMSLAVSISVLVISLMQSVNGAQFLKTTCVCVYVCVCFCVCMYIHLS